MDRPKIGVVAKKIYSQQRSSDNDSKSCHIEKSGQETKEEIYLADPDTHKKFIDAIFSAIQE